MMHGAYNVKPITQFSPSSSYLILTVVSSKATKELKPELLPQITTRNAVRAMTCHRSVHRPRVKVQTMLLACLRSSCTYGLASRVVMCKE